MTVLADKETWFSYLHKYSWTASNIYNKSYIKTSVKNSSKQIQRLIAEYEFDEIDYFGRTVDHINGDSTDNRLLNLRCVSQLTNSKNGSSKAGVDKYIYKNGKNYKVHMMIQYKSYHKSFITLEEAVEYRDNVLMPLKEEANIALLKKERDIEFERGLRDKISYGENDEIINVLQKYGVLEGRKLDII